MSPLLTVEEWFSPASPGVLGKCIGPVLHVYEAPPCACQPFLLPPLASLIVGLEEPFVRFPSALGEISPGFLPFSYVSPCDPALFPSS